MQKSPKHTTGQCIIVSMSNRKEAKQLLKFHFQSIGLNFINQYRKKSAKIAQSLIIQQYHSFQCIRRILKKKKTTETLTYIIQESAHTTTLLTDTSVTIFGRNANKQISDRSLEWPKTWSRCQSI